MTNGKPCGPVTDAQWEHFPEVERYVPEGRSARERDELLRTREELERLSEPLFTSVALTPREARVRPSFWRRVLRRFGL